MISQKFPILGRATDQGFLWPIAKGLAARGHHVTVISAKSPIGKHEVERDGVKVYYLHEGQSPHLHLRFEEGALRKFRELHTKNPFHLVHSMDKSAVPIAKRKKNLNVTVAYDVNATEMAQVFSILGMVQETLGSLVQTGLAVVYKFVTTYLSGDRELLKTADGIFVTTPQQRIFLERYYLYPEYHTYTVPYGAELGDLSPRAEAESLRKQFKIPANAHILLTVTDMQEVQEVLPLLKAFERVAVKKPYAYFVIVGNGPAWKEIEFEMLNLALGSRVIMTGALKAEDIADFISISDAFVNMSSRTTGFDPVMIEAMAQKKVVIGSEVSPIANIIEDAQNGFLLRPADHTSLANLLLEIFSGTVPVIDIGARARDKVLALFDTKRMIQSLEDAYNHILQHRPRVFKESKKSQGTFKDTNKATAIADDAT
jgi:1,2-diacylglycerol 3-alpha-glucosyltransferase